MLSSIPTPGKQPTVSAGLQQSNSDDLGLDLPDVPKGPPIPPKAVRPQSQAGPTRVGGGAVADPRVEKALQQLLAEADRRPGEESQRMVSQKQRKEMAETGRGGAEAEGGLSADSFAEVIHDAMQDLQGTLRANPSASTLHQSRSDASSPSLSQGSYGSPAASQYPPGSQPFSDPLLNSAEHDTDGLEGWEVQRRFRDVVALQSALQKSGRGALPASWSGLAQSRSITSSRRLAPDIVLARQQLLQTCLNDVLASHGDLSQAPELLLFLSPTEAQPSGPSGWFSGSARPSSSAGVALPEKQGSSEEGRSSRSGWSSKLTGLWQQRPSADSSAGLPAGDSPAATEHPQPESSAPSATGFRPGKRIKLMTELPLELSEAELMSQQEGACAGCGALLAEPEKAKKGFLRSIGSSKSKTVTRRCSYTGWLYCPDCHTGDTATLPAAVLHAWDFSRRPVCSSAAAFLEAIQTQPLLHLDAIPIMLQQRCPELPRAHEHRVRACKAVQSARAAGNPQMDEVLDGGYFHNAAPLQCTSKSS
ncbi:hypothetical protein WJX84_000982 [Apatococcus fuscideae]|uniref:Rubicon Homology domain-containing protein n=1 Tax=Apatococcus fuscideae TaxID=2026836 RepID=A0AAW1TI95_9CHLO